MQAATLVLAIALIAAAPAPVLAQDAAVDSLALARQYTEWLYAGEADSLFAHTAEGAREQLTAGRYAETSEMIALRAGVELDMEETWKLRNGDCQYWRTATFSDLDGPFLLRWVLDPAGRITGLGLGPYAQAPPVDAETCPAPAPGR